MTVSLFCDECGAAITFPTEVCAFCGHRPGISVPRSQPVLSAVQPAPSPGALVSAGPVRPGSLLAQRYLIVDKIGQGGFATVYKAKDHYKKNRLVAIKQIHLASLSSQEIIEATDSYNREITLLSRLHHVGLPHIYDRFTDPEHWYVAMDYIEGETLDEKFQKVRGGYLPTKKVLDIGIALCDILGYLHEQRPPVIFRDVKPANIMLTDDDKIYLIDFGIARLYREGQARDTGPLGSPGYAAPEQYGKAQTTARTDIYGLGATLQTLLTGKEPFEIKVTGIPEERRIPAKLQAYITLMMAYDPYQRPQSMGEVKARLQQLKADLAEQRIARVLAFLWKALKKVVPALLLLIPLSSILQIVGYSFWLTLLAFVITTVGRTALRLRPVIFDDVARVQVKDVLVAFSQVLWKQLFSTIIIAFALSVLLFCFFMNSGPGSPYQILNFLTVGALIGISIILGIFGLGSWLTGYLEARKRARLHKQAPQQQQFQQIRK